MNIKPGPLLQKFADQIGAEVGEVCEWVSKYVNGPWNFEVEPTEKERLDSIKNYIQWRVDDSATGRVKASLAAEAWDKSEEARIVTEAPF